LHNKANKNATEKINNYSSHFQSFKSFSTAVRIKKKSNDFVFSDSIATASSTGNTDMLNKSNGIADFGAASVTPLFYKTLLKPSAGKTNFRKPISRNPETTFLQWLQVLVF
jgi:hypothetical protein